MIADLFVRNGSEVKEGDLLVRLDETVTRSNMQVLSQQIDELAVREERLKSERDGRPEIAIPPQLAGRQSEAAIVEIVRAEGSLLLSRARSIDGQRRQLAERALQYGKEAEGISAQIEAKRSEIGLIVEELAGLAELEAKQLVTTTKIAALKREKARLQGELGQYQAAAAQSAGRKAETALQLARIEQDLLTEIVKELRDVQSKIAELRERRIAAEDQLRRIDIRAPQSGTVHQLTVFAKGAVIEPGAPIMLIVPGNDRLLIEARVNPRDIDQLFVGQQAKIRFAAFDTQTTPEMTGTVVSLTPDLSRDSLTGEHYFTTRVELPDPELAKLGANRMQPGIPVDVQIRTADRTALSYLMKPIADQITKAFRER
ncbi:MAG: HlyD family type I secretion periplasmic adaptor subunit [Hyphomicrobium sp.]|nr:HlyD family type I secretion periplasmic adaptor subunit [Hyphomicrobium sp.]